MRKEITEEIKELFDLEDTVMPRIGEEVSEELSNISNEELEKKLNSFRQKYNISTPISNVVPFKMPPKENLYSLGEFELLAAAPEESDIKWYENIITVDGKNGKGGFSVEINPYDDSNEIRITISPKTGYESSLQSLLEQFADKDVEVIISLKGVPMMKAEIYIYPEADLAEGEGVIFNSEIPENSGNLDIDIDIDVKT